METMELSQIFGEKYKGTRVLLTGHTGFKGSWLSLWLQQMGAVVKVFLYQMTIRSLIGSNCQWHQ